MEEKKIKTEMMKKMKKCQLELRLENFPEILEKYSIEEIEMNRKIEMAYPIPDYMKEFTYEISKPNQEIIIRVGRKKQIPIILRFYGKIGSEDFCEKHLIAMGKMKKLLQIMCIHDASHSTAMAIKHGKEADFFMYNKVPLQFPFNEAYVKYYSHKLGELPLVVTELGIPLKELEEKNGVHTQMKRWCTRIFKGHTPRNVYKYYKLKVSQMLGIGRFQSAKRNKMYEGKSESPWSQKRTPILQTMPIHSLVKIPENSKKFDELSKSEKSEWLKAKEIRTHEKILKENGIEIYYMTKLTKTHGCFMCPYRKADYYKELSEKHETLFEFSKMIQKWGSHRTIVKGKGLYWYFWNKIALRRKLFKQTLWYSRQTDVKWEKEQIECPRKVEIKEIRFSNGLIFIGKDGKPIIPSLSQMEKPIEVLI